jgi:hypothetical protein
MQGTLSLNNRERHDGKKDMFRTQRSTPSWHDAPG